MGEIRIVGPGKTRGYPYPVCKKEWLYHGLLALMLKLVDYLLVKANKPWYNYYISLK